VAAFRRGLTEAGLVEDQSVKIEYRFAAGQYDQLPLMAADFVRQRVNLVVAASDPSAQAAKASTTTIPIVFVVGNDPIKLGLVESYNRPGGNATGINILTAAMEAKRLGLLHEVVPRAAVVGLVINPNYAQATAQVRQIEDAAHASDLQLYVLRVSNDEDIDIAFNAIAQQRIAALIVAADPFIDTRRDKIIKLLVSVALRAHKRSTIRVILMQYEDNGSGVLCLARLARMMTRSSRSFCSASTFIVQKNNADESCTKRGIVGFGLQRPMSAAANAQSVQMEAGGDERERPPSWRP
jgi:hypothetical protein